MSSLDGLGNVRWIIRCWEESVIVQSSCESCVAVSVVHIRCCRPPGHSHWPTLRAPCQWGDYTLIMSSISRWQPTLTAASLLSVRRHHTLVSQVGSFGELCSRAPLKGTADVTEEGCWMRHCWHRTRKPLYLPCCYSTVHWGRSCVSPVCFTGHLQGKGLHKMGNKLKMYTMI